MTALWLKVHDRQSALADAVRALPGRLEAWRARREADLPLDRHGGADPVDPACRAWREEGEALRDETEAMLGAGSPHRRHMDAMPGAREAVAAALAEIDGAVFEDRYGRFAWLARHVAGKARETETEPCYVSRFREAVAHAATLHGEDALTEDGRKAVASWLDYDRTCERLRRKIRDWPARADAVLGEWTGPEKDLRAMRRWRARVEPLLDEGHAMLAEGSPHAPHLAAMPEERGKLVETAGRLGGALTEIETAELDRLAEIAGEAAERAGGIAFDMPEHEELMERVHALDARPALPDNLRETVRGHLQRHERLEEDRANVDAFLDLAGQLLHDRDRMDDTPPEGRAQAALPLTWEEWKHDADALLANARSLRRDIPERELKAHLAAARAGPDAIGENAAKIGDRIAQDEEARAAAERQAAGRVRAVQEAERQRLEEERKQDLSEGGGISV